MYQKITSASLCQFAILFLGFTISFSAFSQPVGWLYQKPVSVVEQSGDTLNDYQVCLRIDTQTLIGAGQMKADAGDLRFGTGCSGMPLPYWIEDYINTDSTKVWVKLSQILPNSTYNFMMFYGNPNVNTTGTLNIFEGPYSGNDTLTGGVTQGSGDRQRGFFFRSSRDILATQFGKFEPNGTTRYLTLFDSVSQTKLEQIQVSGLAATLSYAPLAKPMWLNKDITYLITVFLATGDQYYNSGGNTQVGPYLRYGRTGWCNTCTENTFPLNTTTGHYGYPDFEYYVKEFASAEPMFSVGQPLMVDAGPAQATICESVLLNFSGTANDGISPYTVSWTPITGLSNPAILNPQLTPMVTTEFFLTVTDDLGCSQTDSITINVNPAPNLFLGNDTTFCSGNFLTLDAGPGFVGYDWSTGATSQTINVGASGTYWGEATNGAGCTGRDSINVTINLTPTVDLGQDTSICPQETIILDATTAGATYLWSDLSSNPTLSVTTSGIYFVDVTVNGCTSRDTLFVDTCMITNLLPALGIRGTMVLFPNPSANEAILELDIQDADEFQLFVFDATGKKRVLWESKKLIKGLHSFTLPSYDLAPGLYTLKLKGSKGSLERKMIIIR